MSAEERDGLNLALNEATLLGAELDEDGRRFAATLAVLALPDGSDPPDPDPRIQLNLHPVGRLAVSRRQARWDDAHAPPVPLKVAELPDVIAGFGQLPIYGWSFIDAGDDEFAKWSRRLSLNVELGPERQHTLDLFQEGADDFIELRVWFSKMTIGLARGDDLVDVPIPDVIAAGRRWWDALERGDPRTQDAGIFLLKG